MYGRIKLRIWRNIMVAANPKLCMTHTMWGRTFDWDAVYRTNDNVTLYQVSTNRCVAMSPYSKSFCSPSAGYVWSGYGRAKKISIDKMLFHRCITRSIYLFCHTGVGDCVVMSLRRSNSDWSNLLSSRIHEIATTPERRLAMTILHCDTVSGGTGGGMSLRGSAAIEAISCP